MPVQKPDAFAGLGVVSAFQQDSLFGCDQLMPLSVFPVAQLVTPH